MAIFACMRDIHIGTDTANTLSIYLVEQYEKDIIFSNLSDFLHGDILYFILAQIIYFFHLGPKTFLFLLEICTLIPVALCAYIKREHIPIHITMLIFSLLYYQLSFNWIRQSVSSAYILLTLVYAQHKSIKAAFTAIIAILFHSSAIIGLGLLLFVYAFMHIKNKKAQMAAGIWFIVVFLILLLQWEIIIAFGINHGILPERYAGYLRVFSGITTVESWFLVGKRMYIDYLLRIVLVITPILLSKKNLPIREQKNANFYKMISIIGLIIYSYILLGMHSSYGNRITYSIEYIQVLNLGLCYSKSLKYKGSIPLCNIFIIGIVILYNIWLYYVLGWHDTVPFVFGF